MLSGRQHQPVFSMFYYCSYMMEGDPEFHEINYSWCLKVTQVRLQVADMKYKEISWIDGCI